MFTKSFKQLSKHDANIAGGKGASLGEMINNNIPVPDGFVVLSTTFDKFLEITDINIEIDAILNKVRHNEVHTVENASKQIQSLILNSKIPQEIAKEIKKEFKKLNTKYVAVRSSATAEDSASAAWAGQLDSFLNTTEETLLDNVRKCFASLFTPRAIFYRFEKKLDKQKISVAVVVQKMVNSAVSGIAFSVHPVTEDRNQIIIEAGYGLGEAIVSGQITPDAYVVTKGDLNILDKNVYTQERGIFRTTKGNNWKDIVKSKGEKQCLSDKQIIKLSKIIINIEKHYNFPCDIEWAMEDNKFYIVQSRPITTLKVYNNKEVVVEKDVIKKENWYHLGKWDGSTLAAEVWFPYAKIAKNFIKGELNGGLIYLNGDFFLWKKDTEIYIQETYNHAKSGNIKYFSNLKNKIIKEASFLVNYSKKEKNIIKFLEKLQEFLGYWMPLNNMAIGLEKYINDLDSKIFTLAVGDSCEKPWTLQQVDEMRKIKSKIRKTNSYFKLSEKERFLVDNHINKYKWKGSHLFSVHNFTTKEFFDQINEDKDVKNTKSSKKYKIEVQMIDILAFLRFRCAEAASRAIFNMYPIFKKIAKENNLTYKEFIEHTISEIKNNNFNKERSKKRIINKGFFYNGKNTIILNDKEINDYKKLLLHKANVLSDKEFSGSTAQKGIVRGIVKIINNKNDLHGFKEGMILVSYETTPDFVHIMKKSSAIITNFGGLTSHAAIVSREFKIPCIVGTKIATQVLKDGDEVEVDADNGVVRILDKKSDEIKINYDEWKFEFRQRDFQPLLMADQWSKSLYKYFAKEVKLDVSHFDCIFGGDSRGYNKIKQKKEFIKKFLNACDNDKYLQFIFKKLLKRVNEVNKLTLKISQKKHKTKKEILSDWKRFNELFLQIIPWFYYPYYISEENFLTNKVKKGLLKYKKKIEKITDINNALLILSYPSKDNKLQEEQNYLYQIIKFVLENKNYKTSSNFKKLTDSYLDKYSWITTFIELPLEPLNKNDLNKKISESIKNNFLEEFEIREKRKIENQKLEKSILKIIKEDKVLIKDIKNAKYLGWILSSSVEDLFLALSRLIPFYKKIAKNIGVKYSDWIYFTTDEIEDILLGKKISFNLEDRKKSFFYVMEDGKRSVIFGEKAKIKTEEIDKKLNSILGDISEITGTPVYPGVVKGLARICFTPDESKKLKKDEILLCGMTSPDYVPAMKRSKAIITDEGGVLCHAAIISRELGKTCIVGTKKITKAIKTGDKIIVDGYKGVIKIIKKKS